MGMIYSLTIFSVKIDGKNPLQPWENLHIQFT